MIVLSPETHLTTTLDSEPRFDSKRIDVMPALDAWDVIDWPNEIEDKTFESRNYVVQLGLRCLSGSCNCYADLNDDWIYTATRLNPGISTASKVITRSLNREGRSFPSLGDPTSCS